MSQKQFRYTLTLTIILLLAMASAPDALAQTALLSATPLPDAILAGSPESITLTVDRALTDQGTSIRVFDTAGERVDNHDTIINPANHFEATVTLPPIIEGVYTVRYVMASPGESTILVGEYQFTVELPAATLALLTPVDGQGLTEGQIDLIMETSFFDFSLYENRIRVYVDGEIVEEVRALDHQIEGLSPGVHEIRVVLTRLEDNELEDSEISVTIAVASPSEPPIMETSPPSLLEKYSPLEWMGIILVGLFSLLIGAVLGRRSEIVKETP